MAEYLIEHYDTFNTKGCPYGPFFGNLTDQLIPPHYYNILNVDDDDVNNTPGTPIENCLLKEKKRLVEEAVVLNYEGINYEMINYDDDNLASAIDPLQNEILVIEGVENENKGR